MTDSYQFDKNSKLFQKFMAMKNNRNNDSMVQNHHKRRDTDEFAKKNKSFVEPSRQRFDKRERSTNNQSFVGLRKGPLHVTIDDIEEAASEALNESTANHNQMSEIEELRPSVEEETIKYEKELVRQDNQNQIEQIVEKHVARVLPKQERNRERRTRDFPQRPKKREQHKEQNRSLRVTEPIVTHYEQTRNEVCIKKPQPQYQKEIQNTEPNLAEEFKSFTPEEGINFTLGSRQGQYRRKYEKLLQKYQELKETVHHQRKQKQTQSNQKESQNQLLKEKYFQLRSIEDTLTTDLKRYKDRLQSQSILRIKFQEEVKELSFRIMELEQILEGKQGNQKKKNDEINYWKHQNEQLRGQLKQYSAQIESLQERTKFSQSEYKITQKDITNKEHFVDELRKNVAVLITENNIAKDEIYKLTIKLYQLEQENLTIKGDIMRRQKELPHQLSLIQNNYNRSVDNLSPKRNIEHQERFNPAERDQVVQRETHGRRREFARERMTTKVDRTQRQPEEKKERDRRVEPERGRGNQEQNNSRETIARIQFLEAEIQTRSKQKAMNGRLRKQKIQLERELESLIQKMQ